MSEYLDDVEVGKAALPDAGGCKKAWEEVKGRRRKTSASAN
jgi:hypothetical protein